MNILRRLQGGGEESHALRGDRARDAGRWSEAAAAYTLHLQHSPRDFGILVQLGNCAKDAADYAMSLDAYTRALEIHADDADLHLQMGHLYKLMGRRRSAAKSYARALALNDHLLDARRELAAMRSDAGDDDFSLPENVLDFVKADTMDELIAKSRELSRHGDPFEVYSELVNG